MKPRHIGLRKRLGLELYRKLRKTIVREHRLHTIFWECTLRCNVRCRHCGSDCKTDEDQKDMPVTDFLKVIDSVSPQVEPHKVLIIFTGRAAESPELQLSNEQFMTLMEFIKKTRKEGVINLSYGCEGFLGNYETEVRDHFYSCQAGVGVASILADGSISACPSIRANFHQGNIYHDSFIEVWNHRFEKFRNREWARKRDCKDCNMFRYCEGNGMHLRDDQENLLVCHYRHLS